MSNLYKWFYAGMPRNGDLESKTPHCGVEQKNRLLQYDSTVKPRNRAPQSSGKPHITH